MSWEKVSLGEVADFTNGYAFKSKDWGTEGTPIIRIQNLTGTNSEFNYTKTSVAKKYHIFPNDLLVSWSASLGVFEWNGPEAYLNQHIFKVTTDNTKIYQRYLYYSLTQALESMKKFTHGSTMRHVNRQDFLKTKIPLPPLEEQKRIAAILDKADAIRRKRQRSLELADEFLRSVFLNIFGDPVTNPKGWDVARLDEQAQIVGGGTPSKKNADFYKGKICWASSKDIKNKYLFDTIDHITSEAVEKSSTKLVEEGTILIVVKSKILARKVPITILKTKACFNQDIKGIIPTVASHNIYLAYHLMMFEKTLLSLARGVNTEGLTLDHLKNLKIMLPPEGLIKQFTAIAQKHFELQQQCTSIVQNTESLFASLQQKAFRGEL